MKKNQIRGIVVILIIFAFFSVLSFVPPFKLTGVFWLSYMFGTVSILAQIYVMKTSFCSSETVKSKFYGFPIAKLGAFYMIAQLMLSLIFMILADMAPLWLAFIIFTLLLAVAVVGFIAVDAVRDEVEKQDKMLEVSTSCMTTLKSLVAPLAGQCDDATAKKALRDLADEFKYSDPVSSNTLNEIEVELEKQVMELRAAVDEARNFEIPALCKRVNNTLIERNRLCKLNKGK